MFVHYTIKFQFESQSRICPFSIVKYIYGNEQQTVDQFISCCGSISSLNLPICKKNCKSELILSFSIDYLRNETFSSVAGICRCGMFYLVEYFTFEDKIRELIFLLFSICHSPQILCWSKECVTTACQRLPHHIMTSIADS